MQHEGAELSDQVTMHILVQLLGVHILSEHECNSAHTHLLGVQPPEIMLISFAVWSIEYWQSLQVELVCWKAAPQTLGREGSIWLTDLKGSYYRYVLE